MTTPTPAEQPAPQRPSDIKQLPFRELIRRVRAGDQEAATEIVRRYEPLIHKAVRRPLVTFRLQRILDTSDISQSVLATFFVRTAAGCFRLEKPEQLLKLLLTMARNKVRDEARRQQARRRDLRRIHFRWSEDRLEVIASPEPSPIRIVAGHELLDEFLRRLSDEERELAEQRAQGVEWATIASLQGTSSDALRKKLARGCRRVALQLGLTELQFA